MFIHDIRYAARVLLKKPSFSLVAIFTLALGIGANAAIFSVVNAVVLRPVSYHDPDSLVFVWSAMESQQYPTSGSAMPDYLEWRSQNTSFSEMATYTYVSLNLAAAGEEPQRVIGARVTATLFPLLGVQPATGRAFTEADETYGRHRVVLLGHGLWVSRYGQDRSVVGKQIRLGGEDYTVVGVMPRGMPFFRNIPPVDLFIPLSFAPGDAYSTRSNYYLPVVARLKPGVTIDQAQADMSAIAARLEMQFKENAGIGARVRRMGDELTGELRKPLLVLLGAVGFVLLVACVNVANLLLARSASREREFAIRTALGAGRGKLIRQSMIESLLLALTGGAAGLIVAVWSLDMIESSLPRNLPRFNPISIDSSVLTFTFGASVLTSIIFGLFPAFHAAKPDIHDALKEGRSGAEGKRSRRARPLLVIVELALSLVLLVGAGLMAKSFYRLQQVDPGFNASGVLTLQIPLPDSRYPVSSLEQPYPQRSIDFYEQLLERVGKVHGVESAGITTVLPLGYGFGWGKRLTIPGREATSLEDVPNVRFQLSSPDYFSTIGMRLRDGRFFTKDDTEKSPPVAIINETLARRYFPNEDPIGKVIYLGAPQSLLPPAQPGNIPVPRRTIVGVVADVKGAQLTEPVLATVYSPYKQCTGEGWTNNIRLAVRTNADPMSLVASIRAQVTSLDPEQPVADVATLESLIGRSASAQRFNAMLMVAFAGLALVLAAVGIYGVLSYTVEQRTHEIGVRMALGAQRADVLRMVVGHAAILSVAGVGIGLAASAALAHMMETLLFDVSPTDPMTFGALSLILMGTSLLASYLPARRAARMDPMMALRCE